MKKLLILAVLGIFLCTSAFSTGKQAAAEPARPIWFWGIPAGWVAGGTFTEQALAKGNEWMQKNFGITFRMTSIPEGSTVTQGVTLLLAQGQLPDVMAIGGWNSDTKRLVNDMVNQGKLISFDKYFKDPKNYPTLAEADMTFLRPYQFKGKQYVFPGNGWRRKPDDPRQVSPFWMVRLDIGLTAGGVDKLPKNSDDLLAFLKKVKSANYVDLDGQPIWPLAVAPDATLTNMTNMLKQFKGAGWQIDDQYRYGPWWASQEMYEALKYGNTLWREGILPANTFTVNAEQFGLKGNRCGFGMNINGNYTQNTYMAMVDKFGADSAEAKKVRAVSQVAMLSPVLEPKLSAIHEGLPQSTVVTTACPAPDKLVKLFDFLSSGEGFLTLYWDAGLKDRDWVYIDDPLWKWKSISTPTEGSVTEGTDQIRQTRALLGVWRNPAAAEKNPPEVLPYMFWLTNKAGPLHAEWGYGNIYSYKTKTKFPWGDPEDGGFTMNYNDNTLCRKHATYMSPRPSYTNFIEDLTPLESAAFGTADQRWGENLARVISAASPDQFEEAYKTLLTAMMSVADWKTVYGKLQNQWETWLKDNYNDKNEIGKITWRPEFKQKMGW